MRNLRGCLPEESDRAERVSEDSVLMKNILNGTKCSAKGLRCILFVNRNSVLLLKLENIRMCSGVRKRKCQNVIFTIYTYSSSAFRSSSMSVYPLTSGSREIRLASSIASSVRWL